MKTYLVGGAVRDRYLNLEVHERDWVVVGTTAEEMIAAGYTQVGKDFPVFIHPKTKDEYALARTERKTSKGYHGFAMNADVSVTLEEDLKRRDLTINAMAIDDEGSLIDPYMGKADLDAKLLRHVSAAFVEDPVRLLRTARFYARFFELGFKVAPETLNLLKKMVLNGEVDALVSERVWQETLGAFQAITPSAYFKLLYEVGAWERLLPMIPYPDSWALLDEAAIKTHAPLTRFGCFALQTKANLSSLNTLASKMSLPNSYRQLAVLVSEHFKNYQKLSAKVSPSWLNFYEAVDAYRQTARFEQLVDVFDIACASKDSSAFRAALKQAKAVKLPADMQGAPIGAIRETLHEARWKAIQE